MQKATKPCRICGKMFEPCVYCEKDTTAFHWREVACCIEHGQEYLKQVMQARSVKMDAILSDTQKI